MNDQPVLWLQFWKKGSYLLDLDKNTGVNMFEYKTVLSHLTRDVIWFHKVKGCHNWKLYFITKEKLLFYLSHIILAFCSATFHKVANHSIVEMLFDVTLNFSKKPSLEKRRWQGNTAFKPFCNALWEQRHWFQCQHHPFKKWGTTVDCYTEEIDYCCVQYKLFSHKTSISTN